MRSSSSDQKREVVAHVEDSALRKETSTCQRGGKADMSRLIVSARRLFSTINLGVSLSFFAVTMAKPSSRLTRVIGIDASERLDSL